MSIFLSESLQAAINFNTEKPNFASMTIQIVALLEHGSGLIENTKATIAQRGAYSYRTNHSEEGLILCQALN
ncbi:hypothetical protein WBJ53_26610 [Spirosoma sp. SC4-14]|uniref:hypothetical protein n=1 Tax=Spirosoma sp. SC4-14 TaxID=3128900 RepID=UPI0030D39F3E